MTWDSPHGLAGIIPCHDPTRADKILKQLGYAKPKQREKTHSTIFRPAETSVAIGAYDNAAFIADQIVFECLPNKHSSYGLDHLNRKDVHPFLRDALTIYPDGKLLIMALHSVVTYFGYAYYEHGKLLRQYVGDADHDLISEIGEPQPEELPGFSRSKIKDGRRVFYHDIRGKMEEFDVGPYGEELAFRMSEKFFGSPYEEKGHNLPMELFFKQ